MNGNQPKRSDITSRALALPLVGPAELLNNECSEQILYDLLKVGSYIAKHNQKQVNNIINELEPHWKKTVDGTYLLSQGEIVTVVSRALRRGAGQAASDIGSTILGINQLEKILAEPFEPPPSAS